LVPAPGAVDVKQTPGKGKGSIVYAVREPYPARDTLAFIQNHLAGSGWFPVEGDDDAPLTRSSLTYGWRELKYESGDIAMRLWSARWRDTRGNEVEYTLVYTLPAGGHGLQPTHVAVVGQYYNKREAARRRVFLEESARRLRDVVPEPSPQPSPTPCP
jgi:uncharacterized protein DUF4160